MDLGIKNVTHYYHRIKILVMFTATTDNRDIAAPIITKDQHLDIFEIALRNYYIQLIMIENKGYYRLVTTFA